MAELRRRVSIINTFYTKSLKKEAPQLAKSLKADISKAMLSERFVFVLSIRILPDLDEDTFSKFNELDWERINKNWYNNLTALGKIRLKSSIILEIYIFNPLTLHCFSEAWNMMQEFSNLNKNKVRLILLP